MCGATPAVLLYARDAYTRRQLCRGRADGCARRGLQSSNSAEGSDLTHARQRDDQPTVRMVGEQLGVGTRYSDYR